MCAAGGGNNLKAYLERLFYLAVREACIYDEQGSPLYLLKREGAVGQNFRIYDKNGNETAFVKQHISLIKREFRVIIPGQEISVQLRRKAKINNGGYCTIKELNWVTEGSMDAHQYTIYDGRNEIARVGTVMSDGTEFLEAEYPETGNEALILAVITAAELARSVD